MKAGLYQALLREAGDKEKHRYTGHSAAQVNNEQIKSVGGRPWQRADTDWLRKGKQCYVFKEPV